MQYTQIGQTSLYGSRICFGTWQFGGDWGSFGRREAQAMVQKALDLGVTFFDTAQAYGFGISEQLLAAALQFQLRSQRDNIILATKGGLRAEGSKLLRDSSGDWIRQGVEQSLRNLDVDYIDLYQVHWPDPTTPAAETANTLEQLVQEGKILYIGVSNYNVEQIREFELTRKISSLQTPYHLLRRDIERDILPYCQNNGIGILSYGSLAHGLLAGVYSPQMTFPRYDWRSRSFLFKGEVFVRALTVVNSLKGVAEQQGITMAQLAMAWVLANPLVDVAIVGARDPQQLEQIVRAVEIHLSDETLQQIEQILKDVPPVGGPTPEDP